MKNENLKNQRPHPLFDGIAAIFSLLVKSFFMGIGNLMKKDGDFFYCQLFIFSLLATIANFEWHIKLIFFLFPGSADNAFFLWFAFLDWKENFLLMASCYFSGLILISGILVIAKKAKYQKSLSRILSVKSGHCLKVLKVEKLSSDKTKIILKTNFLGLDDFIKQKKRLSASFRQIVEQIKEGKTPDIVVIILSKSKLKRKYDFGDIREIKGAEGSFIVGQSATGTVCQQIQGLPHLLIAGTTGGGKSNFFKQVLLRLLETSKHIQIYLIDLKGGVEMRPFGKLPNIRIADNFSDAVSMLKLINAEMKRRFAWLNKNDRKEIEPGRNNHDRIIIGIDESSILYAPKSRQSGDYEKVFKAREITDEIAKLGRAAGIHLILATQKVSSRTIDTSIQENVTGKMCFRMNTLQGSNLVLGNKNASILPDIPGRGIWQAGNKEVEVQTLLLREEELEESLEILTGKFKRKKEDSSTMLEEGGNMGDNLKTKAIPIKNKEHHS